MATKKIKLTGTASWAKVFEDNRDLTGFQGAAEEYGGQYSIDLELDFENMEKLTNSGSMKQGKVTENGQTVKFTRRHEDAFEWSSGAPGVTDAEGNEWTLEENGVIPNGSTVEVFLSVYTTSRKAIVGTRLDAVKVLEAAEMGGEEYI